MSAKSEFDKACKDVKKLSDLSNEQLLDLYGLYKQATEGDATGSRPGMLDLKGRAKFDAWSKLKGTAKEKAMEKYTALVKKLGA
jgi:acyl-CoA-binding protein